MGAHIEQLVIEFAARRECVVPEADSQSGAILRYLRNGGTLTVLEAIEKFGCFALSQRCGELKRAGWPVVSEMVKVGNNKRVARYSMAEAA